MSVGLTTNPVNGTLLVPTGSQIVFRFTRTGSGLAFAHLDADGLDIQFSTPIDGETTIVNNGLISNGGWSVAYSETGQGTPDGTLTVTLTRTGGLIELSTYQSGVIFCPTDQLPRLAADYFTSYYAYSFTTDAAPPVASGPVLPRPVGPGGWGAGPWGATPWGAGLTLPVATAEIQHCLEAFRRLAAQYQDSPKLKAVLCLLIDQLQDLELTGAQLLAFRDLDSAIGRQLDGLGQNVLERRDGVADGFYRVLLKAKALVVASTGTPEDLLRILEAMIPSTPIALYESFPAGAIFDVAELPIDEAERMVLIAKQALPNTVRAVLEYRPPGVDLFFGFADDEEAGPPAEWGEDIGETGGWAEGTDGGKRR